MFYEMYGKNVVTMMGKKVCIGKSEAHKVVPDNGSINSYIFIYINNSKTFSKNLLKIPMYNLKSYGGRSFSLASAVLWNSLPRSLRDLQSVETFKLKLKKHLFFTGLHGTLNLHCCCTFYELYLIFNRHS